MLLPWETLFVDVIEKRRSRIRGVLSSLHVLSFEPHHFAHLFLRQLVVATLDKHEIVDVGKVQCLLREWSERIGYASFHAIFFVFFGVKIHYL